MSGKQKRHWVATVNPGHMPTGHVAWWKELTEQPGLRYACAQLEHPPDGTPHLQVYTEWTSSLRLSEVVSRSNAHWEARRGSRNEARSYARLAMYHGVDKHRIAGPWEHGEWRKEGTVTDDLSPKERALSYLRYGLDPQQIARKYPDVYFTHHRAICETYAATLGLFEEEEE